MLASINHFIDQVERFAMGILMLFASLTAVTQVIARYVFNNSLFWSEEAILYALISMSFIAASMGVRYAAHISVDVLPSLMSAKFKRPLQMLTALLGILFAVSLLYYGSRFAINTINMNQLSPAMRIPVGYVYMIVPISGLCMLLRYAWILSALIKRQDYQPLKLDVSSS